MPVGADGLIPLLLRDFSLGLNTMNGPWALQGGETPSCQNCIGFPGLLRYCGGFLSTSSLPFNADADWQFFDVNGVQHLMVWANGNLYDCRTGSPVLIRSGVYTTAAGIKIGRCDNGTVMFWTTPGVPLRQYDGTTEQAVPLGGATGNVPIPSGDVICYYAGSVIIGNPVIPSGPSAGTYIGAILPSNINDPTNFLGSNLDPLGAGNRILFVQPMGVAAAGVPPTRSILVGTPTLVFLLQGAINSFSINTVNCPVGCLDGLTAVYIPTSTLLGSVIFLGSDFQFWRSDGITSECLSLKILNFVPAVIRNSLSINLNQRFYGGYYKPLQYYMCDLGQNLKLIYRWQTAAWYVVNGWPTGPIMYSGVDNVGSPAVYIASSGAYPMGLYQVALDGQNFGGANPNIFYNTPYLADNNPDLDKDWHWLDLYTLNNFNAYKVIGTGLNRASDNSVPVSNALTLTNPLPTLAGGQGVWDASNWDTVNWAPGFQTIQSAPAVLHGMLSQAGAGSIWMPPGTPVPLRSPAVSFNISWVPGLSISGLPGFDIVGLKAKYMPGSELSVGGQLYTTQSGIIPVGIDPFSLPPGVSSNP